MAASISNLAFKATLDVAKLAEGGKLAKETFKALRDAAGQTKTDLQKLGDFEAALAKEVEKGTVSQEHARKALDAYRSTLPSVIEAEKKRVDAHAQAKARLAADIADEKKLLDSLGQAYKAGAQEAKTFGIEQEHAARKSAAASGGGPKAGSMAEYFSKGLPGMKGYGSIAMPIPVKAALTAGAAIGGAGMALVHGANEQMAEVGGMARSARNLGMGASEYMVMAEAAEKLRIETGALDASFSKFQVRLGEAAGGSKEAEAAFRKLGLNSSELQKLSPTEQFLKTAEAIRGQGDATMQAAAAQDIFGKGAREILPILRMTRDEFEKMKAENIKSGEVLTDAEIARIKEADAAAKEYKETWTGITRGMAAELASTKTAWSELKTAALSPVAWIVQRSREQSAAARFEQPKDATPKENEALLTQQAMLRSRVDAINQIVEAKRKEAEYNATANKDISRDTYEAVMEARRMAAQAGKDPAMRKEVEQLQERLNLTMEEEKLAAARKEREQQEKERENDKKQARKQALDEIKRLNQEAAVAHLDDKERAIALERLRAIERGAPKELADKVAAMKRESEARKELKKITDESLSPQAKYNERIKELQSFLQRGLNPVVYLDGFEKARKEFLSGIGLNIEQLKKPAEKHVEELRKIEHAYRAGAITLDQMIAMKQKAQQEFDKPLAVNVKTTGVDAAMKDSAEALDRVEAFRNLVAGEQRKKDDLAEAERKVNEAEKKRRIEQNFLSGKASLGQWLGIEEEAPYDALEAEKQRAREEGAREMAVEATGLDEMGEAAATRPSPDSARGMTPLLSDVLNQSAQVMPRLIGVLERLERNALVVTEATA